MTPELVDRTTLIGERHLGHRCTLFVWHEERIIVLRRGIVRGTKPNILL